jgi:hypothetical protein
METLIIQCVIFEQFIYLDDFELRPLANNHLQNLFLQRSNRSAVAFTQSLSHPVVFILSLA